MSDQVRAAVLEAIKDHGPISFAEFMEIALYGPGGFYEDPPIGKGGHFVTSPHVHPIFGELVGLALRSMWDLLGRPAPFRMLEVGAGDGTLAGQILDSLRDVPTSYLAVERSPGARASLAELAVRGVLTVPSLEVVDQDFTGCVLANELFDNLPFRLVRSMPGGPAEIRVGVKRGRIAAIDRPLDPAVLVDYPLPASWPLHEVGVIQLDAVHLLERMARMIARGYALVVDYAWAGASTPPHGYRGHQVVERLLDDPGSSDITVGVDFEALQARARELGLNVFPPVSQRGALLALGFGTWFERERHRQVDALERREGREAVRTWSERNEAGLLVSPDGLGRLRWMVLATPGMPWPEWLEEAARLDR